MLKSELTYQIIIPNKNNEVLELAIDKTGVDLTIPRYEQTPARTLSITFAELDQINAEVAKYKKMQEIAGC